MIRVASGGGRPDIQALTGLRFFAAFSVVVAGCSAPPAQDTAASKPDAADSGAASGTRH